MALTFHSFPLIDPSTAVLGHTSRSTEQFPVYCNVIGKTLQVFYSTALPSDGGWRGRLQRHLARLREFMHQGEIHNFPEIAERFRRRHTHFPGNSRTVPKSTKSASEYLLGCLHGLTVCTWIYSPGVLSRRQPASSKSDPHVHCRENKRTV